jgi:hypothetical protein
MLLFHATNSIRRILLYDCTLPFYCSDKIIFYEDAPKKKFSHFRCAPCTVHFGDPWYLVFYFLNFKTPHIESHYETNRKIMGSFPDCVTGILQ